MALLDRLCLVDTDCYNYCDPAQHARGAVYFKFLCVMKLMRLRQVHVKRSGLKDAKARICTLSSCCCEDKGNLAVELDLIPALYKCVCVRESNAQAETWLSASKIPPTVCA